MLLAAEARMSSVDAAIVGDVAEARTTGCGQPIRLARADGTVDVGAYRCEHRACEDCQRRKSLRVTAAISDILEGHDRVAHLTLTQQPWQYGTYPRDGQACERALRDHWSAATELARRIIHANRKYDFWSSGPRGYSDALVKYWKSYWTAELFGTPGTNGLRAELGDAVGGRWAQTEFLEERGSLTYVWAKECELAAGSHYHWHYHVALPDRRMAELLNACWQATRTQPPTCQTHISAADELEDTAPPDDQLTWEDAGDLAEELAHYLSGTRSGAFLEDATRAEQSHYFAQLEDVRLYGAAGDWRPIGVAPEPSDKADVVAVAWSDSDRWFSWSEWWDSGRRAAEIAGGEGILQSPGQWAKRRPSRIDWEASKTLTSLLETLRNNFRDPPASKVDEALQTADTSGLDPPDDLERFVSG